MNIKTKILLLLTLQIASQHQYSQGINLHDKLQYSGYVIGTASILYGHNLKRDIGRVSQRALNYHIKLNTIGNCICNSNNTNSYEEDFELSKFCIRCEKNIKPLLQSVEDPYNQASYNLIKIGTAIISANTLYHLIVKLKNLYYKSS